MGVLSIQSATRKSRQTIPPLQNCEAIDCHDVVYLAPRLAKLSRIMQGSQDSYPYICEANKHFDCIPKSRASVPQLKPAMLWRSSICDHALVVTGMNTYLAEIEPFKYGVTGAGMPVSLLIVLYIKPYSLSKSSTLQALPVDLPHMHAH